MTLNTRAIGVSVAMLSLAASIAVAPAPTFRDVEAGKACPGPLTCPESEDPGGH